MPCGMTKSGRMPGSCIIIHWEMTQSLSPSIIQQILRRLPSGRHVAGAGRAAQGLGREAGRHWSRGSRASVRSHLGAEDAAPSTGNDANLSLKRNLEPLKVMATGRR